MVGFAQVSAPNGGISQTIDALARTPLSQVLIFVAVCTVLRVAVFPMLIGSVAHRRGLGHGLGRFLNESTDALVYAGVVVFFLIRPFVVQTFIIPSGSMWDTLKVGDLIVANKAIYRYTEPKRGDIIVFRPPIEATLPGQVDKNGDVKVDFIKRLIGLPGDVIEIRDDVLYRNGEPQEEPYVDYSERLNAAGTLFEKIPVEDAYRFDFKLVDYKGEIWPVMIEGTEINRGNIAEKYRVFDSTDADALRDLPPAKIPEGYVLAMGDNRNNSFDGRMWGLVPLDSVIGRAEFIWWPPPRWGKTR